LAYLRLTCVVFFGLLIGAAPGNVAVRQRVAIIDSGVARTPELGARIVAEYDLAAAPARPAFRPRYDHGTMVATILARANPAVDIVSLRIDDPAGCPPASNPPCQPDAVPIAAAIRRATALHVDAINISLALADDPAITTAVREAAEKGIVVVLAAGNDGLDRPANLSMARAAYPHAVLVGAVDAHGHPWSGTNRRKRTLPVTDMCGGAASTCRPLWRMGARSRARALPSPRRSRRPGWSRRCGP
jgi:subtilisin family serine protease